MADPRSYLYVPGDRPSFLAKALDRGADAVIIDLEDAVALADKSGARGTVAGWLDSLPVTETEIWLRINAGAEREHDLAMFADRSNITGFCAAKIESEQDAQAVSRALVDAGSSAVLMPLLESATAVLDAVAIARVPRVRRLQIGEADLAVDVGIDPTSMAEEFAWARSTIVFASAAAGISAPVAAVSTDFRDLDLLARSTEVTRRMGFFGRACIHPAQVMVANDAFLVSVEAAQHAQTLLDMAANFDRTTFTGPDGTMVDEAVLRAARRTVAQTRSWDTSTDQSA